MADIKLGNRVRCVITGFNGIATAKLEYLDGTIDYAVTPEACDKGYPKSEYISDTRLEKVDNGMELPKARRIAGFAAGASHDNEGRKR